MRFIVPLTLLAASFDARHFSPVDGDMVPEHVIVGTIASDTACPRRQLMAPPPKDMSDHVLHSPGCAWCVLSRSACCFALSTTHRRVCLCVALFRSQAVLIVNVASRCGYTDRDYRELQALRGQHDEVGVHHVQHPSARSYTTYQGLH